MNMKYVWFLYKKSLLFKIMEYKSSCRLLNIGLSISLAALIMPLSFILTTLTTTSITGPAVYAYDVMETDKDNYGRLNFVSSTTANASSSFGGGNATSNATITQIPDAAMGPIIPESEYLVISGYW